MGENAKARAGFGEVEFRAVLGSFATGITVVTGRDRIGRSCAITVSAFTSVSLEPPLVLYCLGKQAFKFDIFARTEVFAINLLTADQGELSDRFAREIEDDLSDLPVTQLATGSPILSECLAAIDCRREAVHEAGDHLIIVGRVAALKLPNEAEPLIYFRGGYRELMP